MSLILTPLFLLVIAANRGPGLNCLEITMHLLKIIRSQSIKRELEATSGAAWGRISCRLSRSRSGRDFMKKLNWILGFTLLIGLSGLSFAADYSAIKPPAGTKVAVVVFEDLECPTCARSYPIIWSVAKAHNVPVLLHDFPLVNIHPWTFRASLYARYFDTQSQKLGNDFREYIYKSQNQVVPGNLDQFARKFADENKVALPFSIDPESKLKDKINADYELGLRLGVNGTPTIYIVGNNGSGQPFVDIIKDFPTLEQSYAQKIEDMQRKAAAPAAPTPAKNAANKPHKKKPS